MIFDDFLDDFLDDFWTSFWTSFWASFWTSFWTSLDEFDECSTSSFLTCFWTRPFKNNQKRQFVFSQKNLPLHCSIHHANWISWIVTHYFLNFFTLSELTTINNSILTFRAHDQCSCIHSIALAKHSRLKRFKALANRRCSFGMERNEKPIGKIFIQLDLRRWFMA